MKYSYSFNEELFHGQFDTAEEAVAEAINGERQFWVGENVPPTAPEDYWYAEDWLEHVACQDDYSGDFAEGFGVASKEELAELEAYVRPILAAWLERHGLRPTHWIIENPVKYEQDGTLAATLVEKG